MNEHDSTLPPQGHDELAARYREASALEGAAPHPALRAAVLAKARALAAQRAASVTPQTPNTDFSFQSPPAARRAEAANDRRWRISAVAGVAVFALAGLVALQLGSSPGEEQDLATGRSTAPSVPTAPATTPAMPTAASSAAPPPPAPAEEAKPAPALATPKLAPPPRAARQRADAESAPPRRAAEPPPPAAVQNNEDKAQPPALGRIAPALHEETRREQEPELAQRPAPAAAAPDTESGKAELTQHAKARYAEETAIQPPPAQAAAETKQTGAADYMQKQMSDRAVFTAPAPAAAAAPAPPPPPPPQAAAAAPPPAPAPQAPAAARAPMSGGMPSAGTRATAIAPPAATSAPPVAQTMRDGVRASEAHAPRPPNKCILPAPDGGNADVASLANIHGKIIEKTSSTITIKEKNKDGKTLIKFNKKTELYTVFGGDFPLNVLRTGQEAWVWFENCKEPEKGTPLAAMIMIFSTDPNDANPEWNTNRESWPAPSSAKDRR